MGKSNMKTLNTKSITTYNNIDIFKQIDYLIKNETSKHFIIPNICVEYNKNISGFSKELYNRYPLLETNISVTNIPKKLCSTLVVDSNPATKGRVIVANMYCQSTKKSNKRSLHYGQLVYCMYEVKNFIQNLKIEFPDFTSELHCPKFGIGSAGGNWVFIEDLIDDIWGYNNVFIYNHTIPKRIKNVS